MGYCNQCGSYGCPGCNAGGICQNLNTNGLNCNSGWNQWNNQCNEVSNCGCPVLLKSDCVFYSGATTSCLGIQTNATLTSVIQAFDAKICTLTPPSGN